MRGAFHVAWSLMRVPHLALSLFFFPLLLSIVVVIGQLVVTLMLVGVSPTSSAAGPGGQEQKDDAAIVRGVLYGSMKRRGPLRVCRWVVEPGGSEEVPPSVECAPDRLDVAVQVSDPASFDVEPYVKLYQGDLDRLHVCTECQPDAVVVVGEGGSPHSTSYSVFGGVMLALPFIKRANEFREVRDSMRGAVSEISTLFGELGFVAHDIKGGIRWSQFKSDLPMALNISFLIVVALWLALKAHRKVLDYFGHNHVLLPLVAACGKKRFYAALWWLTVLRVACFLAAALPILYIGFYGGDKGEHDIARAFSLSWSMGMAWIPTLILTISLATVVASIAELQHRDSLVSFVYRYVPIVVAMVGALMWSASFLVTGEASAMIRKVIALLPVAGMFPIFIAPVIKLPISVMVVHAGGALVGLVLLLRRNARWFAAHLESV